MYTGLLDLCLMLASMLLMVFVFRKSCCRLWIWNRLWRWMSSASFIMVIKQGCQCEVFSSLKLIITFPLDQYLCWSDICLFKQDKIVQLDFFLLILLYISITLILLEPWTYLVKVFSLCVLKLTLTLGWIVWSGVYLKM